MRDSEWIKGEDSIKTQLSTVIQHSLCTFQLAKSSYLTNWSLIIFLSQPTHLFHRKGRHQSGFQVCGFGPTEFDYKYA